MATVKKPPTKVRVRFDANNDPELNAEDLRATGDSSLERLAEADRVQSNRLSTKGDGDGWLTKREVHEAVGIHFSIQGGYQALIEVARERQATELPMSDVQKFMAKGASGPVRHMVMPPQRQVAPDPIRAAAASTVPTGPKLLDAEEARLDQAFGADAITVPVSRGFAMEGYGGPELIRYMMGDWRNVIASHDFSAGVCAELEGGAPVQDAIKSTATSLAKQIESEIGAEGVKEYMQKNSRATQIGIHGKKATALAAWPDDRIDKPADMPNSPFCYARTGYLGVIHKRVLPADQAMIALEVDQQRPADFALGEYYIPSHVPPTKIRRFFLGFSNWHNAHEFVSPPERKEQWYRFDILERDEDGRPTDLKVTPITSHQANRMESWTDDGASWVASAGASKDDGFVSEHPMIATTIAEIRQSVSP